MFESNSAYQAVCAVFGAATSIIKTASAVAWTYLPPEKSLAIQRLGAEWKDKTIQKASLAFLKKHALHILWPYSWQQGLGTIAVISAGSCATSIAMCVGTIFAGVLALITATIVCILTVICLLIASTTFFISSITVVASATLASASIVGTVVLAYASKWFYPRSQAAKETSEEAGNSCQSSSVLDSPQSSNHDGSPGYPSQQVTPRSPTFREGSMMSSSQASYQSSAAALLRSAVGLKQALVPPISLNMTSLPDARMRRQPQATPGREAVSANSGISTGRSAGDNLASARLTGVGMTSFCSSDTGMTAALLTHGDMPKSSPSRDSLHSMTTARGEGTGDTSERSCETVMTIDMAERTGQAGRATYGSNSTDTFGANSPAPGVNVTSARSMQSGFTSSRSTGTRTTSGFSAQSPSTMGDFVPGNSAREDSHTVSNAASVLTPRLHLDEFGIHHAGALRDSAEQEEGENSGRWFEAGASVDAGTNVAPLSSPQSVQGSPDAPIMDLQLGSGQGQSPPTALLNQAQSAKSLSLHLPASACVSPTPDSSATCGLSPASGVAESARSRESCDTAWTSENRKSSQAGEMENPGKQEDVEGARKGKKGKRFRLGRSKGNQKGHQKAATPSEASSGHASVLDLMDQRFMGSA